MKVGVYFPSNNAEHAQVIDAFAQGIVACGDEVVAKRLEDHDGRTHYDAAVVFGVGKAAVHYSRFREAVRVGYNRRGKRVVVLEKGYVRRDEYYAAGFDGLNGRADFCIPNEFNDGRWLDLGIDLLPWQPNPEGDILVVGQVPWDASVESRNHHLWLKETVERIHAYTDRPIRFRPHPLSASAIAHVDGARTDEGSLAEALGAAWAVVTQNSNVGVDATIAGKPVWTADEGSMVYHFSHHDLREIESPSIIDREPWAAMLAYCQWTKEEMAQGLAWAHLRPSSTMSVCGGAETAGAPGQSAVVGPTPNAGVLH